MERNAGVPRNVAQGIGFTIGVLWILMAASALWACFRGISLGRSDWAMGWGLVGGLLLVAGSAAIFGTWWHYNRVLTATHDTH
jgi:hypothetical protein